MCIHTAPCIQIAVLDSLTCGMVCVYVCVSACVITAAACSQRATGWCGRHTWSESICKHAGRWGRSNSGSIVHSTANSSLCPSVWTIWQWWCSVPSASHWRYTPNFLHGKPLLIWPPRLVVLIVMILRYFFEGLNHFLFMRIHQSSSNQRHWCLIGRIIVGFLKLSTILTTLLLLIH